APGSAPQPEPSGCLKTTVYVVHTAAFATFCFARLGADPLKPIAAAIRAGGDTDSIAAITGAWRGALHGEAGLPPALVDRIDNGPFGPTHLRALAHALAQAQWGEPAS